MVPTGRTTRCFFIFTAVAFFVIWFSYAYLFTIYPYTVKSGEPGKSTSILEEQLYLDFVNTWCRLKRAQLDWRRMLLPCADKIEWRARENLNQTIQNRTDASKSYLTLKDFRPAGQFSRFSIQTVTHDKVIKTIGGDSWRVKVTGPSASLAPTVIDHNNGTYEVILLIFEPGQYQVKCVLDFSLCDGFLDPPNNWFIKGNSQGTHQPENSIAIKDRPQFLFRHLWNGEGLNISILPTNSEQFFPRKMINEYGSYNTPCGIKCNEMWDGNGRWVNKSIWKSYFNLTPNKLQADRKNQTRKANTTLWIYGDSVGHYFYQSVLKQPLCTNIFKKCKFTYNWSYKLPKGGKGFVTDDNLDFSVQKLHNELFEDISTMEEESVMILNLGLHYARGISFGTFKQVIDGSIRLLTQNITINQTLWKFRGRAIWKSTTSVYREKYTGTRTAFVSFYSSQRNMLFNAYAMQAMCTAGIQVLDVFSISGAFPEPPNDGVHHSAKVFQPVVELLQQHFGRNL